jgi:hypothetical protein
VRACWLQGERDVCVAKVQDGCKRDSVRFLEEVQRQRQDIESKVADSMQRLRILYAPPRTAAVATVAHTVASERGSLVGSNPSPRNFVEPDHVAEEVEKLLALVRVSRTQI